jgi:hypothetical protein
MQVEPAEVRHPLNLPPGSIRAILAVMITGLFIVLLVLPADRVVELPLFLYPLLSLLLVFTVTHSGRGDATTDTQPFGMPRWIFRLIVFGGIAIAVSYQFINHRDLLIQRLTPTTTQLSEWPVLLGALFGGFIIGRLLRYGPWKSTAMYQDMLAWLALLCMIGLAVETLAVIFIRPTIPEGLNLRHLESFLTAAVALYFGARS